MRRRILGLLCALALCLGLLPATALAAETNTVYVGGVALAGSSDSIVYATTNENGEVIAEGATAGNYNIKWDGSTLTLHNATIQKELPHGLSISGSAIGVTNQNGNAELTVRLEGSNTIDGVSLGIYVDSSGGGAALNIKGDGTLVVNSTSDPIFVISSNGQAALSIENAKVTTTSSYSFGVTVQSVSSEISTLTVDGGSLTATAQSSGVSGIRLQLGSSETSDGTPTITVSNNAIVRANGSAGGIASNSSTGVQTEAGTDGTGGIVFDGNTGTVYGSVALDENLTIGEGESLAIGDGASLTVPSDKTLTNNGTVTTTDGGSLTNNGTINNSGTLPDSIEGSQPPKITTESPLPEGTVGTAYSQPLAATGGDTITWSSSDLPAWLTLDTSTGAISGTPTTADTYNFTVTAANDAGSDSKKYMLTIAPATVLVTDVTLDRAAFPLFTGERETLVATVAPNNATNQNVTWSSDKPEVATVENGEVTAKAAGTATITATAADGSDKADTCTVTVTDKTYAISAEPSALTFDPAYTGYAQPAAQTVTVKNTGNQQVTVALPAAKDFVITAGTGFADNGATIEPNGTATFTVQPEAGLAAGTHSEGIAVSGTGDATATITATFTVRCYVPPAPAKTPSQQALEKIVAADDGDTVTVSLPAGDTVLDAEVFEALADRDVTLVVKLPGGAAWAVDGKDVPEHVDLTDLDMGVTLGADAIPADVVNTVTGEAGAVQLALAHDGPFGFEMTLTAPVGAESAGLWANLYRYDEAADRLVFQASARVGEDGTAALPFDHASQWAIVLDTVSHELPFSDVSPADWFANPVGVAYRAGLMTGYADGSGLFGPDDELTRAQAAAVLFRALGADAEAPACGMADVDPGAWYAGPVDWAVSSGLMVGYDDGSGRFGVDDALTREQLAVVLWRAAGSPDAGAYDDTLFSDGDDASKWAKSALAWAVKTGVLKGSDDGSGGTELRPTAAITRAEAAAMLARRFGAK